jgi:D-alanyl-D-alanine carboxypeptidase
VIAVAVAALAAETAHAFSQAQRTAMNRAVRGAMVSSYFPGIVVGLWTPEGSFVKAFGKADIRTGRQLRVTDRFRIGSVTKTFTATVILQLVQEGKLGLDEYLSDFFPTIPGASTITVRQLLNHTSGIPTTSAATQDELVAHPHHRFDIDEVIASAVAQPYGPAGTYLYSDTGYQILGKIIEQVSKRSLAQEYRTRILQPLRLTHTSFVTGTVLPRPFAHGYGWPTGYRRVDMSSWTTSYAWAAGSMVSTLGDLKRYARPLATGAGLLDPAVQAQRLTFVPTDYPGLTYGLGIWQLGSFLGHDGAIPGYNSVILYSPTLNTTVVALASSSFLVTPPGSSSLTMVNLATLLVAIAYPPSS